MFRLGDACQIKICLVFVSIYGATDKMTIASYVGIQVR